MTTPSKSLIPFDLTTNRIPEFLRQQKRWAPWKGVWNEKRQKWDKIPLSAVNPKRRISTAAPDKWFTYEEAVAALRLHKGFMSGIGFVMTGMENLVGIDLDHCRDRDTGKLTDWAQAIIDRVDSYAEVSPSGTGVRVFAFGAIDGDFCNHKAGVEVYEGSHPRFLTVTGEALDKQPLQIKQAALGSLTWLANSYREKPSAGNVKAGERPLLLAPSEVPELHTLDIPPAAREFFGGNMPEDRLDKSRELIRSTMALFRAGLSDVQVQSFLVGNHFAMEIALAHRSYSMEKAEDYLWRHHTVPAREEIVTKKRMLTLEDFDLSMPEEAEYEAEKAAIDAQLAAEHEAVGKKGGSDVEFEAVTDEDVADLPDVKPQKAKYKFKVQSASKFSTATLRHRWFIEGVLPHAELGAIYGPSGSGKTFFVMNMMMHLALGRMWCGRKTRKARLIYVAAEGANGLRLRIRAACRRMGVEEQDFPLMIIDGAPNMLDKDDVKALVTSIQGQCPDPVDLVVVDTLSQVTPGANENSSEDMGRALSHLKLVGKALGAMMLVVGHTGKDTGRGQRGWSGIKGALDVEIEVLRLANFRTATITKMKDGEGENTEFMFNLTQVALDVMVEEDDLIGPELREMTSCVVDFELDASVVALMKEDEAKRQAKERAEKREATNTAKIEAGAKGNWPYLSAALVELYEQGDTNPTEKVVRTAFDKIFSQAHPKDENGDSRRQAWRRLVTENGMKKHAVLEDGRFRLLNPPTLEHVAPPVGDDPPEDD